jgi:hypothetical protein
MDNWIAAFKAMGGVTAIGVLIDLAMYRSEKDKLKALLEDWWLRFTDLKWSNFGRAEAELAVQILDRWAGPRLWSLKRWRFSVSVTAIVLVLSLLWDQHASTMEHHQFLRVRHAEICCDRLFIGNSIRL